MCIAHLYIIQIRIKIIIIIYAITITNGIISTYICVYIRIYNKINNIKKEKYPGIF